MQRVEDGDRSLEKRLEKAGYRVVGFRNFGQGCCVNQRAYVLGHHPELGRFGGVRFITGWTNQAETEVVYRGIKHQQTFSIIEKIAALIHKIAA
jgi:hypothetical protein